MKQRAIMFSGSSVFAILKGQKRQTRRTRGLEKINSQPETWRTVGHTIFGEHILEDLAALTSGRYPPDCRLLLSCPYGRPGDRLWVKEEFAMVCPHFPTVRGMEWNGVIGVPWDVRYKADDSVATVVPTTKGPENFAWQPARRMARWASRITLEIVDVRIERLQDINFSDCIAEGIDPHIDYPGGKGKSVEQLRSDFRRLWDDLNAKRGHGWHLDPWVWVVSFKLINNQGPPA